MQQDMIRVTPAQLADAIRFGVKTGKPIMVWGPPGCGKSEIITTTLGEFFPTVHTFFALLHDPTDIKGFPMPNRDKGVMEFLPPAFLPRDGEPIGFFMDELPNAPTLMKNTCLDLALNPERYLSKGSYPCAAGNMAHHKTGASGFPSALNNRFWHLELVPSVQDWCKNYAIPRGLPPVAIAYARNNPDVIEGSPEEKDDRGNVIRAAQPDLSQRAFSTARSFTDSCKAIAAGLPVGLETQALCGVIGDGHGVGLAAWLNTWNRMISLDHVLNAPNNAPLPDAPDVTFAMIRGLALRASETTWAAIVDYALRLPREFGQALVNDCISLKPNLQSDAGGNYVRYSVATQ